MFKIKAPAGLRKRGTAWGLMCVLLLCTNPPFCLAHFNQAKELIYKLKEGLPRGTLIGAVGKDLHLDFTAADPPFVFSLPQKKVSEQYVNLSSTTGELHTSAVEMDRETLCPDASRHQGCVLSLDVFVLPQQYFQLVKVKISIEDVNDNRPRFPVEEICVSVPENAPRYARYAVEQSAVDPDAGPHGVQTYWLVNDFGGVFTLDVEENEGGELTPFLIVMEALDRETRDEYVTDIIAEDGGTPPLLGTATLRILITDVNDNCPQFTESQVNVTLLGNATRGAHLARLHASDPDLGANAQISYAYSERVPRDARSLFHLDRVTGSIKLVGKTDSATSRSYKLTVLANGPGCIPAVATVSVHVIGVVTGPPVVTPRYIAAEKDGTVLVKESEPAFSPIAFFTVKNTDVKRKVDCHLEGSGPFRLTPYKLFKNEYLLETTEPLDYEQTREYELSVVARNGLDTRLSVRVQVLDENDNAPSFQQSLVEVSIEENNAPNAFLAQLHATDRDSGRRGEVSYHLGSDTPPGVFLLDAVSGVLSVAASLDREEKETYRLTVRATDRGTPRREAVATVVLTVRDRNDNSPRFIDKDFTFFVPENFPGFGEIGVLSVTDPDAGQNGWVALSILNGSDGVFVMDTGRGALRAKTPLDRETQGTYTLWVEAADGGVPPLSCVAMVTVLLLDVNDNPPVVLFPQSNQSYLLVLPSTLPGTSVTEVYAVDRDTGMNAVIAYSIVNRKGVGEPGGSFDIDPETGNITLKRELSNRGLYSLLVKVSDHGQPEPLHSTVMVNLFVNETVSNESYIQSLLSREADMEVEEKPWYVGQTEGPESYELLTACQPVLVALSATCLGLLFIVIALTSYICCSRAQRHRKKRLEVEIPLKMNSDEVVDRKLRQISSI